MTTRVLPRLNESCGNGEPKITATNANCKGETTIHLPKGALCYPCRETVNGTIAQHCIVHLFRPTCPRRPSNDSHVPFQFRRTFRSRHSGGCRGDTLLLHLRCSRSFTSLGDLGRFLTRRSAPRMPLCQAGNKVEEFALEHERYPDASKYHVRNSSLAGGSEIRMRRRIARIVARIPSITRVTDEHCVYTLQRCGPVRPLPR